METSDDSIKGEGLYIKDCSGVDRNIKNLGTEEEESVSEANFKYAESNLNVRKPSVPKENLNHFASLNDVPNCPTDPHCKENYSVSDGFELSEASKMISNSLQLSQMSVEFSDLTYCVRLDNKKGFKSILKGISGRFVPGQLTAIVGPSGAGKTTLMNILAGCRTIRVSGHVLVNGSERDLKSFGRRSCYIMQDDHLLPYVTVQESMDCAAALKLGEKVPLKERNIVTSNILDDLNLQDSRSTRVANLSGGEKKRLSIALELVNNPPVMFFDEPTSGLDSRNSYQCISLLKKLAEEGRTIICTIHQPSARVFEKIDHLYALSDGQCIYRGTTFGLIPFLSSLSLECPSYHNPADFLIEIASGEYGSYNGQLVGAVNNGGFLSSSVKNIDSKGALQLDLVPEQGYFASKDGSSNDEVLQKIGDCVYTPADDIRLEVATCSQNLVASSDGQTYEFPASFITQFTVLFKRTYLSVYRDKMLTKLRLAANLAVGAFLGILFYNVGNEASKVQSNVGSHFFTIIYIVFTAMMPTILTFPLEMNVFFREHLNHWYSLKAYYLAKTMADIPFQILFPMLYAVLVYFLTNQPYEISRFVLFTSLCILTSLVAQSIGLTIGAAMDIQQAVFLGPTSAIPPLLFSGFFVTISVIPVYLRWLTYLSYVRYAFEGIMLTIYGMNRETLDCSEAFCMFKHPKKILEQFDFDESLLWVDFVALFVYFLLMRILGYFILRRKLRIER